MKLTNYEKLLYDLIFSEEDEYEINISKYIEDIYEYDKFMEKVENVLSKSEVMIIDNDVDVKSDEIIWILKVKK